MSQASSTASLFWNFAMGWWGSALEAHGQHTRTRHPQVGVESSIRRNEWAEKQILNALDFERIDNRQRRT